jgi:hypothetical protein
MVAVCVVTVPSKAAFDGTSPEVGRALRKARPEYQVADSSAVPFGTGARGL